MGWLFTPDSWTGQGTSLNPALKMLLWDACLTGVSSVWGPWRHLGLQQQDPQED